jgi:hypothetical protein
LFFKVEINTLQEFFNGDTDAVKNYTMKISNAV